MDENDDGSRVFMDSDAEHVATQSSVCSGWAPMLSLRDLGPAEGAHVCIRGGHCRDLSTPALQRMDVPYRNSPQQLRKPSP